METPEPEAQFKQLSREIRVSKGSSKDVRGVSSSKNIESPNVSVSI